MHTRPVVVDHAPANTIIYTHMCSAHTCTHSHTHTCTHSHLHTQTYIHTLTLTHTYTHTHIHTHTHTHTHRHTHTYTHILRRTFKHAYNHIDTRTSINYYDMLTISKLPIPKPRVYRLYPIQGGFTCVGINYGLNIYRWTIIKTSYHIILYRGNITQ